MMEATKPTAKPSPATTTRNTSPGMQPRNCKELAWHFALFWVVVNNTYPNLNWHIDKSDFIEFWNSVLEISQSLEDIQHQQPWLILFLATISPFMATRFESMLPQDKISEGGSGILDDLHLLDVGLFQNDHWLPKFARLSEGFNERPDLLMPWIFSVTLHDEATAALVTRTKSFALDAMLVNLSNDNDALTRLARRAEKILQGMVHPLDRGEYASLEKRKLQTGSESESTLYLAMAQAIEELTRTKPPPGFPGRTATADTCQHLAHLLTNRLNLFPQKIKDRFIDATYRQKESATGTKYVDGYLEEHETQPTTEPTKGEIPGHTATNIIEDELLTDLPIKQILSQAHLTEREKEIVFVRLEDNDLSLREIGRHLGIAKSEIHRKMNTLREKLEQAGIKPRSTHD